MWVRKKRTEAAMKSAKRVYWVFLVTAILAAGISRPVLADDDPPGRVARLNLAQGSVSFQPAGGGDNDWTAAAVNHPMSTGDRLWADRTAAPSCTSAQPPSASTTTPASLSSTLADNSVQLQLSAGSAIVRLRRLDPMDAFEVDAPNLAFSLLASR